jgi:hypothetical protein
MKVLFEIVHPADVLFFRDAIERLGAEGAEIVIASRDKDIACRLLDEMMFAHTPLTRAGSGTLGLGLELLVRDWRLLRLARRERPDVMVGFGGVAISHVGRLTGIPSISFYDTEDARLQIALARPFITEWHVPSYWRGPEAEGRTFRFNGFKELAYLDPRRFRPSPEKALALGLDGDRDNFFIRTVAWAAAHDRGRSGWGMDTVAEIVERLSQRGKVHLSAEGTVAKELEPLIYRGRVADIHHLLGHCRLFVGESATMAAEAALLGVPAICSDDYRLGYISELAGDGLITQCPGDREQILAVAERRLGYAPSHWQAARDKALEGRIDVAGYILDRIRSFAPNGDHAKV